MRQPGSAGRDDFGGLRFSEHRQGGLEDFLDAQVGDRGEAGRVGLVQHDMAGAQWPPPSRIHPGLAAAKQRHDRRPHRGGDVDRPGVVGHQQAAAGQEGGQPSY